MIGHKHITEAISSFRRWVGEHSILGRSSFVKNCGLYRKENVGISNDKISEKLIRRKTKDSSAMLIS